MTMMEDVMEKVKLAAV